MECKLLRLGITTPTWGAATQLAARRHAANLERGRWLTPIYSGTGLLHIVER
jgi:hypothetical protein